MSSSNKRKMSKSPSKSKPKSTKKTKRKSNRKSSSNTPKPYHFTQDTICDVDTDGRCKAIQHSTHKDNLDDLQCSQCTNEWIRSEKKWVCVFDGCDKIFCDGCIRKDKAKTTKKTPRSLLTKTKRSRFEVSSDSDDEYTKQTTPSTSSQISDSEVSETTKTNTKFAMIGKGIKRSLFKLNAHKTHHKVEDDEDTDDSINNDNNNRKRKIKYRNNDNEPLHKRRRLNEDSLRSFMENESKYIKCLEKENIELRRIGVEVLEDNKCLKEEGMKCINVIDGLKAENKRLRDKIRRIMEFIEEENANNVNSDVVENKEDVVGDSGDIEEGEIVERAEDGEIDNEINHNNLPLRKRKKKSLALKKECTTIEKLQLIECGYQIVDGVMDLTVESD